MSRHSRQEYEAALAEMRAVVGGRVEQVDFVNGFGPYRRAAVTVRADHDEAGSVADDLARLAVQVHGYLTMVVYADQCEVEVSVTRDVSMDEIGGLMATRVVEGGEG